MLIEALAAIGSLGSGVAVLHHRHRQSLAEQKEQAAAINARLDAEVARVRQQPSAAPASNVVAMRPARGSA